MINKGYPLVIRHCNRQFPLCGWFTYNISPGQSFMAMLSKPRAEGNQTQHEFWTIVPFGWKLFWTFHVLSSPGRHLRLKPASSLARSATFHCNLPNINGWIEGNICRENMPLDYRWRPWAFNSTTNHFTHPALFSRLNGPAQQGTQSTTTRTAQPSGHGPPAKRPWISG